MNKIVFRYIKLEVQMNRLQKIINNLHNNYLYNLSIFIKYIPKYIIKKYIKCNPKKYYELGYIYQFYYKNYELMHECYNKAIDEESNSSAMSNLGNYYQYTEYNYELMKKYYIMSIKLGLHDAYINLIYYYR